MAVDTMSHVNSKWPSPNKISLHEAMGKNNAKKPQPVGDREIVILARNCAILPDQALNIDLSYY